MTDLSSNISKPHQSVTIIAIHCMVFAFFAWLFLPNMDIDMYENFAWGQTFEWGSFKHPTFFVWVTRCWFSLFPTNNLSYFILSYCNAAIGLFAVLGLAKLLITSVAGQQLSKNALNDFLLLVLGFSLLSLPFNFYAAVFNADSILISLWPCTTYAFFYTLHANNNTKKWVSTLLLAILAAAAILGKYFSSVLLLSLFIISLSKKEYRAWYKTAYPYVCFALFICLLIPHIVWEYKMGFPFLEYSSRYVGVSFEKLFRRGLTFALTGFYFFLLPWVAWFYLKQQCRHSNVIPKIKAIDNRLLCCLVLLPLIITLSIIVIADIGVKDRWANPIWFALPIFMANQLVVRSDNLNEQLLIFKKSWVILFILISFAFVFTLGATNTYLNRHHDYVEARQEMVEGVEARFQERFPNESLSWVAGNIWPDNIAPMAFYLVNHPRALPGFPDQNPALINPHVTWNQEYGVLICGKKYLDTIEVIQVCVTQTEAWLRAIGKSIRKDEITYHARGWRWRFLEPPKRVVTVFWIEPIKSLPQQ